MTVLSHLIKRDSAGPVFAQTWSVTKYSGPYQESRRLSDEGTREGWSVPRVGSIFGTKVRSSDGGKTRYPPCLAAYLRGKIYLYSKFNVINSCNSVTTISEHFFYLESHLVQLQRICFCHFYNNCTSLHRTEEPAARQARICVAAPLLVFSTAVISLHG